MKSSFDNSLSKYKMKDFLESIDKDNNDYLFVPTQTNASGDDILQTVLIEEITLLKEYIDDVSFFLSPYKFFCIK